MIALEFRSRGNEVSVVKPMRYTIQIW